MTANGHTEVVEMDGVQGIQLPTGRRVGGAKGAGTGSESGQGQQRRLLLYDGHHAGERPSLPP
jgi:hypothetical protein